MIVEMAHRKVEDQNKRGQLVCLKLKLGDDSYTYTKWFTIDKVNELKIILRNGYIHDINGTYHVDHCTNDLWIMQGDNSRDDREKVLQTNFHHGFWHDRNEDDGIIEVAAWITEMENIGPRQLLRIDYQVLA